MKFTERFALLVICCVSIGYFISCDGNDEPSTEERQEKELLAKLAGTWKLTQAKLNDVDVTDAFSNATITFERETKVSATNFSAYSIWPGSGAFTFELDSNSKPTGIAWANGVTANIETITESTLVLAFHSDTAAGRKKEVAGDYKFTFQKQ